jgi:hypothetical protein
MVIRREPCVLLRPGEIYYSNIAIAKFNDNSSHAEVLAMFDKAIANVD